MLLEPHQDLEIVGVWDIDCPLAGDPGRVVYGFGLGSEEAELGLVERALAVAVFELGLEVLEELVPFLESQVLFCLVLLHELHVEVEAVDLGRGFRVAALRVHVVYGGVAETQTEQGDSKSDFNHKDYNKWKSRSWRPWSQTRRTRFGRRGAKSAELGLFAGARRSRSRRISSWTALREK